MRFAKKTQFFFVSYEESEKGLKFSLPLFIKEKGLSENLCYNRRIRGVEFLRVITGGKKLDRRNIRSDGAILPGL